MCATPATSASPVTADFIGRVGVSTNPRSVAPVITSQCLRENKDISFSCISRLAAAKAVHAAAIANVKNMDSGKQALVRINSIQSLVPNEGQMTRGLSAFKITILAEDIPSAPETEGRRRSYRTKVGVATDYLDLAKKLHHSYMNKNNVILECMGDKSLGVIAHSLAVFNEKVTTHELLGYPRMASGKAQDGSDIALIEVQVIERGRDAE
jgi:stage V sporulation protein SpoVS